MMGCPPDVPDFTLAQVNKWVQHGVKSPLWVIFDRVGRFCIPSDFRFAQKADFLRLGRRRQGPGGGGNSCQ